MATVTEDVDSGKELTGAICQRLVDDFVQCTGTDEALAQMYLQDNDWILDRAVGVYFDETGGKDGQEGVLNSSGSTQSSLENSGNASASGDSNPVTDKKTKPAQLITVEDSSESEKEDVSSPKKAKNDRREIIFITYNIDGICEKNLEIRTNAVCKIIQDTKADIVFLQEVIPLTAKIIRELLSKSYEIISAESYKGFPAEYFTMSLFRKETVKLNSHKVIDYDLSVMTRNMLTANVTVNGIKINLLNTHLESTKDFKDHRMRQFEQCYYGFIKKCPIDEPVVMAGDLNMRDKELNDAGGLPQGIIDAWIATGRKKECEYTWDMLRNDNLDANFGKFKPRCRFDRILIRESKPSKLIPATFNLIGIERLKPYVCFPSDHWGILSVFKTLNN